MNKIVMNGFYEEMDKVAMPAVVAKEGTKAVVEAGRRVMGKHLAKPTKFRMYKRLLSGDATKQVQRLADKTPETVARGRKSIMGIVGKRKHVVNPRYEKIQDLLKKTKSATLKTRAVTYGGGAVAAGGLGLGVEKLTRPKRKINEVK